MDRNYDVVAIIRSNLTEENRLFIIQRIEELKQKLGIIQDGDVFYGQKNSQYDDFGPGVNFFVKLKQRDGYFEVLEYNSYLEGILHGTV